jgi:hypothetical protein
MPEKHLQDFDPIGDSVEQDDILNVQHFDGQWKNYQVQAEQIFGLPLLHFIKDFNVKLLDPNVPETILGDPGTGFAWLITNASAQYFADQAPNDQIIAIRFNWWESNFVFAGALATSASGSACPLYWDANTGLANNMMGVQMFVSDAITLSDPATADGTLRIEFDVAKIPL